MHRGHWTVEVAKPGEDPVSGDYSLGSCPAHFQRGIWRVSTDGTGSTAISGLMNFSTGGTAWYIAASKSSTIFTWPGIAAGETVETSVVNDEYTPRSGLTFTYLGNMPA